MHILSRPRHICLLCWRRNNLRPLPEQDRSSNQGHLCGRIRHRIKEIHWGLSGCERWVYARQGNQDNSTADNSIHNQPSSPSSKQNNKIDSGACNKYHQTWCWGSQDQCLLQLSWIHQATEFYREEYVPQNCIRQSPLCKSLWIPKIALWCCSHKKI